jgi:hypothetical protein
MVILIWHCFDVTLQVIKSRRIRWAGQVARMGREEMYTDFWWGNLRERDHWETQAWMGCGSEVWEYGQDRAGSG